MPYPQIEGAEIEMTFDGQYFSAKPYDESIEGEKQFWRAVRKFAAESTEWDLDDPSTNLMRSERALFSRRDA